MCPRMEVEPASPTLRDMWVVAPHAPRIVHTPPFGPFYIRRLDDVWCKTEDLNGLSHYTVLNGFAGSAAP